MIEPGATCDIFYKLKAQIELPRAPGQCELISTTSADGLSLCHSSPLQRRGLQQEVKVGLIELRKRSGS